MKILKAFVPFLDKERYLLVCFFEFFLNKNSSDQTISLLEIQNELAVSSYRLREIIATAQDICAKIPELHLSQVKDKRIRLTGLGTLQLKKIILQEAHASLRFKIFIHISLNPKSYSDSKFQNKNGISRATYFRFKSNLINDLDDQLSKSLHTNESCIRYYIYSVILYFSYLDFFDDPDSKKKLVDSINQITLLLKLSPTNTQRKQHLYFGAVSYWRSKNGHRLTQTDNSFFVEVKNTPEIVKFTQYFINTWHMKKTRALRCVRFFTTFLLTYEEINAEKLPFLHGYDTVNDLTQQQLTIIRKHFTGNSTLKIDSLTNKLLKTNVKILIPVFLNTTYTSPKNCFFYENSYLDADQLTKKLLNVRNAYKKSRPLGPDEYTQLYYSYLFTIMGEIPISSFSDRVHIAVDFSPGVTYTDYVKKKLIEFSFLNVQIDSFVNPQTDIYITNNFDQTFKNEQVIWERPPQTAELIHLRKLIVRVKNNKLKKKECD